MLALEQRIMLAGRLLRHAWTFSGQQQAGALPHPAWSGQDKEWKKGIVVAGCIIKTSIHSALRHHGHEHAGNVPAGPDHVGEPQARLNNTRNSGGVVTERSAVG